MIDDLANQPRRDPDQVARANWRHQARQMTDSELFIHAQRGKLYCRCGNCFCCMAAQVHAERINPTTR